MIDCPLETHPLHISQELAGQSNRDKLELEECLPGPSPWPSPSSSEWLPYFVSWCHYQSLWT